MNDLTIRTRLALASIVTVVLVLGMWFAMYGMASTTASKQVLVEAELAKAGQLQDLVEKLVQLDTPGNDVLASLDDKTERANLVTYEREFRTNEREFLAQISGDAELREGYVAVGDDLRTMIELAYKTMDDVKAHNELAATDEAAAREALARGGSDMAMMDQAYQRVSRELAALNVVQRDRISGLLAESEKFNENAVVLSLGLLVVALSITVAMGWLLVHSITTPIGVAVKMAERIAEGDLREVPFDARGDEIGRLLVAMGHMSKNLRGLITNLSSGVAQLSSSSTQIGATASEYASTASQTATTVTEITTTVEEIKQTSVAAATAAREVATGSDLVAQQGREGRDRLEKAVTTMQTINERVTGIAGQILQLADQTSQIGAIVESVNDLAEQSNLLAVNASIEAAKAGDHGRGFAVVATEVRSLAEQSKRATQQIRAILADIQKATQSAVMATEEGTKRADDGRRVVEGLRELIDTLAGRLEETSAKGNQIAGAASQQASGIALIASAMDGVATAGKDNAKGVRQLDQAVRDLSRLATELQTTSERFQV